jgi:UDP-N-acetylmuramoylalanine-D-glutamate ligase
MGRAGNAAARSLAAHAGADTVTVCDRATSPRVREVAERLLSSGIDARPGTGGEELLARAPAPGCVVKSPGIPLHDPLLTAAAARGIPCLDEAELGWRLDGRPMVGVTGTNGKSTVCALAAAVLRAGGHEPAIAGNTVFGPPLSELPAEAGDTVVAELSSFQLAGSPDLLPEVGVFTNLSDDHWEHHGGRDAYRASKRRMFLRDERVVPLAIVNSDDVDGRSIGDDVARRGGRVVTFGSSDADVEIRGADGTLTVGHVRLRVRGCELVVATRLVGEHNAANVAAAVGLADGVGLDLDLALAAIADCEPVPGRLEVVGERHGVVVAVDYAHNPAGIRAVLSTVRAARTPAGAPRGRVIAVSSGLAVLDRRQNRGAGEALAEADLVVLSVERTSVEESYAEPAPGILEGIGAGGAEVEVVPDRREAIRRALELARPGDVVLLLNRGVRRTPMFDRDGRAYVVDDRDEARAALAEVLG